jgi:predicted membrane-bound mannosyltransferase
MTIDKNSKIDQADLGPAGEVIAAEEQMVTYLAELLKDEAQQLTAQEVQHLMVARHLAVRQLVRQQAQTFNHSGNVLQRLGHHLGEYWEQHRILSAAVIFLAIMLTFFAAQKFEADRSLEASDAFLLASDLPPEAYADKGFDTWLEANNN